MMKFAMASLMLAGLALPAAAQTSTTTTTTTGDYYVVQDVQTKKCTVVNERPKTTTSLVIGSSGFKTQTEAEGSLKTTKVCTTN
ncbi:MAG: hypothetical protein JWN71_1362 [Xanthobacteraceae bacterium]|jgi:hypothetical protein|nr:hypothetical protein [Xanthobacteraceae bacterium]